MTPLICFFQFQFQFMNTTLPGVCSCRQRYENRVIMVISYLVSETCQLLYLVSELLSTDVFYMAFLSMNIVGLIYGLHHSRL